MKIEELKKVKRAMNKGCAYGNNLLKRSIQLLGLCRSVVVDKNDYILNGEKVVDTAIAMGITKVKVIETTGDTLVVVKRVDVDANSKKGMEIQMVDNFSTEQNLVWDAKNIICDMNENLAFNPREWGADECLIEDLDLERYLKQNVPLVKKVNNDKDKNANNLNVIQTSLFD